MYEVEIPINSDGSCTKEYIVKYKVSGSSNIVTVTPNPTAQPIVISGLMPSTSYDIEIQRVCCNNAKASAAYINITTGS